MVSMRSIMRIKPKKHSPDKEEYIKVKTSTNVSRLQTPAEFARFQLADEQLKKEMGDDRYREYKRKQYKRFKYGGNYDKLWPEK